MTKRALSPNAIPSATPRLTRRVAAGLCGAIGLACTAGVAGAQPQPGFPAISPPTEGVLAVPVEIAVTMRDGTVSCRPPEARLPSNELLRLQIVNLTDHTATLIAPDLFGSGERIASVVRAQYELGAPAVIVQPGTIGQVVFVTGEPGTYNVICDVAVQGATQGQAAITVLEEGMWTPEDDDMAMPGGGG